MKMHLERVIKNILWLASWSIMIIFSGCSKGNSQRLFSNLNPNSTKVHFSNNLDIEDSINVLNYIYAFNGAGVGVGDLNNDGLEDLVFAGNQVSSKIYLNHGDFEFEDITDQAGMINDSWCTGVSLVDINTDGYLDIYFSVAGSPRAEERKNLLYINNGKSGFVESAEKWGIADANYSTQSVFFDYDRDGDLDLYLLNHSNDRLVLNTPTPKKVNSESPNTDKLYRNNGDESFTDVSKDAGITIEGYGLGVTITDIDNDNWPDIYVSNDFISNDLLYINNADGTFENRISEAIREQSYNGMGNDIADFNNDGLADIMVMDMLSSDPIGEKMMAGSMNYDKFTRVRSMGYEDQFVRNTLQLNQGQLHFSEIGRYAGVHRTDWSWAPLFADLDNDGWKDIYITNGYLRDITNRDYIDYSSNLSMFKSVEKAEEEGLKRIVTLSDQAAINFVYKNNGDLTFQNISSTWMEAETTFSNGAVYADLDNDGDLDLVVNNINAPASMLRNESAKDFNYLQVALNGPKLNPFAVGAKVYISSTSGEQWLEQSTVRGFMSSVSPVLHFGLGLDTVVHVLEIKWPDGRINLVHDIKPNQRIVVEYDQSYIKDSVDNKSPFETDFIELTAQLGLATSHQVRNYPDFKFNPLFPYRRSSDGFQLASGDFDGDGLEDLFVGSNASCRINYQEPEGGFTSRALDKNFQGRLIQALSVDINGDQFNDLVLLGHDSIIIERTFMEIWLGTADRSFRDGSSLLPEIEGNISAISVADFDNDGDIDMLLSESPDAPYHSRLRLLSNDGEAFLDSSSDFLPDLDLNGLIRDLAFADYNGDKMLDIIIASEWSPVVFLVSQGDQFVQDFPVPEWSDQAGWWRSVGVADVDLDGDIDVILGNRGLNSGYDVSTELPAGLDLLDVDGDSFPEALMTYFVNDEETIQPSREAVIRRYPFFARLFPNHLSFAQTDPEELVKQNNPLMKLFSKSSASYYLENDNGHFIPHELPGQAQLFPMEEIIIDDFKGDGQRQLLLAGGFSIAEGDGRGYGQSNPVLVSVENGELVPAMSPAFYTHGDITSMVTLNYKGSLLIAAAIRNEGLKIFQFCKDEMCGME